MKFISTSSNAFGRSLPEVVGHHRYPNVGIQVGIGPRPGDADSLLQCCVVSLHANVPGHVKLLNQDRDFDQIIEMAKHVGAVRYTVHAPRKASFPTEADFKSWAANKFIRSCGVPFGIETMYPADNPYWLDSFEEMEEFLSWTDWLGWRQPVVADVAHLQICVEQGTYTERQVEWLLTSSRVCEFHYSDNDGAHDNHRPYRYGKNARIDRWLSILPEEVDLVDEGRRRPNASQLR